MTFFENRILMQSLLKQLLNADNVYNNTVETYKKEKRSIKEESDDRIKKAVRNKNDELVAEKKRLSKQLQDDNNCIAKINDGIADFRLKIHCCAEILLDDTPNKKDISAEKLALSFLGNKDDITPSIALNAYEKLKNSLSNIITKKLQKSKKQHFFRAMLVCSKYAKNSRDEREKEFINISQNNTDGIITRGEREETRAKEYAVDEQKKVADKQKSDLEYILSASIEQSRRLLSNEAIETMVEEKRAFYDTYGGEKSAGVFSATEFPSKIYLGEIATSCLQYVNKSTVLKNYIANTKQIFDENGFMLLPWSMKLDKCDAFLVRSGGNGATVQSFFNDIMFAMCQQLPAGDVELLVADPVKKGLNIKQFLSFKEMLPSVFGKKIYTSVSDIRQCFADLSTYIDNTIQHNLANKFDNVFQYNVQSKDYKLPIKVLCLFNITKCISSGSDVEMLLDILESAPKCGIVVLMDFDETEGNRSVFSESQMSQLNKLCVGLNCRGEYLVDDTGKVFAFQCAMPSQMKLDQFFENYVYTTKSNLAKGVDFSSIAPEKMFTLFSRSGISLPVGKAADATIACLEFGRVGSSHHALITGGTGSGKSTLLHTIIISAALNYSPDELNLYLMDFKSGTEFKIYENFKIPHIKLLAVDAMQEFGESILLEINDEMERRARIFKAAGASDLPGYISATGNKLPRVLIIMDEFQILFSTKRNRKVAQSCANLTNAIVKLGRSYGIHLIMSTQSIAVIGEDSSLDISTIEQMRIRIGLKFDEKEAKRLFGNCADDALRKMRGAIGTAVYNKDYTEFENTVFKTAYCSNDKKKEYLSEIASCLGAVENMRVFEGGSIPEYPSVVSASSVGVNIPLGEPIKIGKPLVIEMTRKKPANIAIVGADDTMMLTVTANMLYGIKQNENCKLLYMDGDSFVDEPIKTYFERICNVGKGITEIIDDRIALVDCVDRLYTEMRARKRGKNTDNNNYVVFINHAQNIDLIRLMLKGERIRREKYKPDEEENLTQLEPTNEDETLSAVDYKKMFAGFMSCSRDYESRRASIDDELPPLSECFRELVESGFGVGIYFIVVFDDATSALDAMGHCSITSSMSSKFPNKIVFSLSDDQCAKIISDLNETPKNEVVAVYTNSVAAYSQFKPYKTPDINKSESVEA